MARCRVDQRRTLRRTALCASAPGCSALRLLAVATMKIGPKACSCIQVSKVPNIRCDSPPLADAAGRGERFFDLIDPQHDRCHPLGLGQRCSQAIFAFADEFLIQDARIHPQQRHIPVGGHDFRAIKLLPHPCTPKSRMPRGGSRPKSWCPPRHPHRGDLRANALNWPGRRSRPPPRSPRSIPGSRPFAAGSVYPQ